MLLQEQEKDQAYSVGLDASLTSFGVCCIPLSDNLPTYHWSLSSSPKDGSDLSRIVAMSNDIIADLCNVNVAVAVFEDYGPINRFSGKITQRAEMCGILKYYFLVVRNVPVITLPPTSLKEFATAKGRASKDDMLAEAARHGMYFDTHDEADAFFAARLGLRIANGEFTGVSFTRVNP